MALLLSCLSLLIQSLAAFWALRLIPISKNRRAWILIASALAVRCIRIITQIYLAVFQKMQLNLVEESFSFVVSLLLAMGVISFRSLFLSMRAAHMEAEDANRAKDEFLANVSHEIRTPLTVILTSTELAIERLPPGEAKDLIGMTKDAGESLHEMVEDLLDLSSARRGHIKITEDLILLRHKVDLVTRMLKPRAISKGLSYEIDIAPDVPDMVIGDGKRVKQVMVNLIVNAIKFTHSGGVRVEVKTIGGAPDGAVSVQFAVSDTGIGIPRQRQKDIFDPFVQVDATHTRPYDGAGLGLALCKSIVEKMGGRIWVESEEGRGSTFIFTIPFRLDVSTPR